MRWRTARRQLAGGRLKAALVNWPPSVRSDRPDVLAGRSCGAAIARRSCWPRSGPTCEAGRPPSHWAARQPNSELRVVGRPAPTDLRPVGGRRADLHSQYYAINHCSPPWLAWPAHQRARVRFASAERRRRPSKLAATIEARNYKQASDGAQHALTGKTQTADGNSTAGRRGGDDNARSPVDSFISSSWPACDPAPANWILLFFPPAGRSVCFASSLSSEPIHAAGERHSPQAGRRRRRHSAADGRRQQAHTIDGGGGVTQCKRGPFVEVAS
jgi:hypothetical protein